MGTDHQREKGILIVALSIARGMLREAYNGDASKQDMKRILESTDVAVLKVLLGAEEYRNITHCWDLVTEDEKMMLHGIKDDQ